MVEHMAKPNIPKSHITSIQKPSQGFAPYKELKAPSLMTKPTSVSKLPPLNSRRIRTSALQRILV